MVLQKGSKAVRQQGVGLATNKAAGVG